MPEKELGSLRLGGVLAGHNQELQSRLTVDAALKTRRKVKVRPARQLQRTSRGGCSL